MDQRRSREHGIEHEPHLTGDPFVPDPSEARVDQTLLRVALSDVLDGVIATTSGYIGGSEIKPTYHQVASGATGHTEAVQIVYDPTKIDYAKLLEVFWRNIDPTVRDRQFCDRGKQYRTGVFYHSKEQKRLAEASKKKISDSGKLPAPIVTEITEAGQFWPAEDYHQDYYFANREQPYCRAVISPKLKKLGLKY